MRRPLLLLAAVPLALLTACSGSGNGGFGDIGSVGTIITVAKRHEAPVLKGSLLDGGSTSTAALKGKVVVVNLWGSWCTPCREEAPALTQVASDMATQGVSFLGVDTRDVASKAKAFRSEHGQTYPTLVDTDGSVAAKWTPFPPTGTPITVLLDRDGRVAGRFVGAVTYDEISKAVTTLAAEKA